MSQPTSVTGWTRMPAQDSVSGAQFQRVVWTGGRFVATAAALDGSGGLFLDSSDGATWNKQVTPSADRLPIVLAAGPLGVIATGSLDDQITAWSSRDGQTWTVRRDAFPKPTGTSGHKGPTTVTVKGLVATNDGWLAVGREDPLCQLDCGSDPIRPLVWRSDDGLTWRSVSTGGLVGGMDALARTTEGYVAVGLRKSRAAVWTSSDGSTWTAVPDVSLFHPSPTTVPPHSIEMDGVAADNGVVVGIGMDGPYEDGGTAMRAWWSLDGRAWSKASVKASMSGQVFSVTSTPEGFLATGPSGEESCLGGIWESADGRAWDCAASDPAFAGFGPYAAAASSSVIVAVGLDASQNTDQGFPGAVWRKQLP
jgi:hypothetical protein